MYSVKLLLLLSFQVSVVFTLHGNIFINLPLLDETQLIWPQKQIRTLEYLLRTLTEVGNVTLVGWQQIWNHDRALRKTRTIELTILTDVPPVTVLQEETIDFAEELLVLKAEIDEMFSSTGVLLSGSVKRLFRSGEIQFLEMDKNSLRGREKEYNGQYWEKNITVTRLAPVKKLIKKIKRQSVLPVSVLRWNADGTLNLKSSFIVPERLATVKWEVNTPLFILEEAMMAVTKGYLLQTEDIIKYVAAYMKQNVPGYIWIVWKNWAYAHIDIYAIAMVIEYNEVKLEEPTIKIAITGVKIPEL